MRFLIFIWVAISVWGCNQGSYTLNREVKAFIGREILFSDNLQFCSNGTDMGQEFFDGARFKIINYIDTAGCEECKLHLFDWGRLQRGLDTLDLGIKICFIVWSSNLKSIEQLSRIHRFNLPIFSDSIGVFLNSNPIPLISGFRTCLVDSCNRVVLVGSPLYNNTLLKLYIESCSR